MLKGSNFRLNRTLAGLILSVLSSPLVCTTALAESLEYPREVQEFLNNSEGQNQFFNFVLEQRLKASIDKSHRSWSASDLVLSLPSPSISESTNVAPNCELPSPISVDAGRAYCEMQRAFIGHNPTRLRSAKINSSNEFQEKYKKTLESLNSPDNDTMVVVIPGIFGEFIDQTAFGEIFHQGQRQGSTPSSFEKDFANFKSKLSNEEIQRLWTDRRFLLKNLLPIPGKKITDFEIDIEMPKWLQVASVDSINGHPLFKAVVLGLEAMSLESLGHQDRLASLYLRRLEKFLTVYNKIYGHFPNQIIFVGYSRGTPIGYEMLAQLAEREKQGKAPAWSQNVRKMVSLGGVVFGTALADKTTVARSVKPADVELILALKNLLDRYVHLPEDLLNVVLNQFVDVATNKKQPSPGYNEARKKLVSALATNSALLIQFAKNIQEIRKNHPEFDEKINSKMKNQAALFNLIQNLTKLQNVANQLDNGDILSVIKDTILPIYKDLNAYLNSRAENTNLMTELGIDPQSMEFLPDPRAYLAFGKKLQDNWGLSRTFDLVKSEELDQKQTIQLMIELNRNMYRLSQYFRAVWDGATELSTQARMDWWSKRGALLPERVEYLTLAGTLGPVDSDFYKVGTEKGFDRASADEAFLNKSWNDLRKVGQLDSKDGLDLTFAGSKVNDSQVDWFKTILWPHLAGKLTQGKQFQSKFLGFVRTHHWGLALPFSFASRAKENPNKIIVNPFPRAELLEAIVISTTPAQ